MEIKTEENLTLTDDPRVVPTPANIHVIGIHDKGLESDIYEKTGDAHTAWDLIKTITSDAGVDDDSSTIRREQLSGQDEKLALRFEDHSVNSAYAKMVHGELVFQANKATNSTGNFNGGGTGNKPIASIYGYEGLPVAKFPIITSEVLLRTKETIDDADETQLGVSYNAIVDINNDGSELVVLDFTNTLGGAVDKYGKSGEQASLTDYDISTGVFYVVGNLPTYTGALPWTSNPITLDTLLNGDGADHLVGYPDATFGSSFPDELVSTDGGHPAGVKMASIQAQVGGSGNALRSVTAITELTLDGEKII